METKTTTERKELVESIFILANACRGATNDPAYVAILDALESEYFRPLISKSSSERKLSLLSRTFSGYIEQAIQPEMKNVRGEEARSLLTTLISALQYGFDLQVELSVEDLVLAVLCHKRIRTAHNQQASERDKGTVRESIGQVDLETHQERIDSVEENAKPVEIKGETVAAFLEATLPASLRNRFLLKSDTEKTQQADELAVLVANAIEEREMVDELERIWIRKKVIPLLLTIDEQLNAPDITKRQQNQLLKVREILREKAFGYDEFIDTQTAAAAVERGDAAIRYHVREGRLGKTLARFGIIAKEELKWFFALFNR